MLSLFRRNGKVVCRMSETDIDPESDNNETVKFSSYVDSSRYLSYKVHVSRNS